MSFVHCIQFYSSEQNVQIKKKSSSESNPNEEETEVDTIMQLMEEVIHPHIDRPSPTTPGYSTSYRWPSLNNGTLGLHRYQPAQSCQHISSVNASAPNGYYWIDPNLGCASDAVMVYCNFTSGETCIHTNATQVGLHLYTAHSSIITASF